MSNPLKTRWLIAGFVWLLAVGMTYWNCSQIDAVMRARERNEQVRKEILFQTQHAKTLDRVRTSHDALFQPVPSVTLGMIAVDRQVRALASGCGLQAVDLRSEGDQAADDRVTYRLSMHGALAQVFHFLSGMPKYPYLPIRRLHVTVPPYDHETIAEMEFSFQYRLLPPAEAGEAPLQVSGERPATEGNPL